MAWKTVSDTSGTKSKKVTLTQIGSTYNSATFRISYSLNAYSWNLLNLGWCIKLNGTILNNETQTPWRIVRNHPTAYGWNKKHNNTATYGNTNRIICKATNMSSAVWNPSTQKQKSASGDYYSLGYNSQVRKVLISGEVYSEDITIDIPIGTARQSYSYPIVSMSYMKNGEVNTDWMTAGLQIQLETLQIPEPPTPTITVSYLNYVDDSPTTVRLTANVGSNEAGFFTLRLENITNGVTTLTETKGATTITYDIPVNEAYYDKTFYYRARVYGADIDKVSTTDTAYVEYPMLPLWYYQSSSVKKQVRRGMYYDPLTGIGNPVKVIWYNNGGSFEK